MNNKAISSRLKQSTSNNCQFVYSSLFYLYLSRRYNIQFTRTKHLVSALSSLSISKSSKVHILGSGASVLETLGSIPDTDIVIGNNMSCLLDIHQDLYFAEFCGRKISNFSEGMFELVKLNRFKLGRCYFKNIRAKYNEPCQAFYHYTNLGFEFIADQSLCCQDLDTVNYLLDSFFTYSLFLPQFKSTVLSLIFICCLAGYNDITLHGFDFGGPYFFDTKRWYDTCSLRVDSFIPRDSFYPLLSKHSKHSVSRGAVPLSFIINALSQNSHFNSLDLRFANP